MPHRAAQIQSEPALYEFALKALMRRAHSVFEMKQALVRRCADEDLVKRVLARLRENRYLDDSRYAVQFARQQAEGRRRGRHRVARELRARGVADAHIEAAIAEVFADTSGESAQIRARIERKLRALRSRRGASGALDPKKLASLYASLLHAGFPADLIRRELHALTKAEVNLPEESEP